MSSEVSRAVRALHRRAGWACDAASEAGVPGRFRVWEQAGAMAVLATDPALGFLSTVSGETVPAAIDLVDSADWRGVKPTLVVPAEPAVAAENALVTAGFARMADRLLAVNRLTVRPRPEEGAGLDVVAAGAADAFVEVLLAGYEVGGTVAAFIRAEHRLPMMRRFLAVAGGTPIAAAAMTIHGDVAVLGGASTLPAYRGRGAQSLLLRHRLRVAADAGCVLAVATARPESVSAANLQRAGFRLERRAAWARS
ncbi:GNAT family N-acetyltransferase [Lentzea sp. BCCO 10_0061]|uniref:GNAT family N-acetyltransferase n=1 Tax=Lentzea sokolovensis TaxID=3095429 RepID=A0ABU4V9P7_9PSEU|nr:GNAT family N-acetyltransferase [Lentzea sp. BCCO 10_0061]MDX8148527.1 GNAT family N-acetyltransferase [Lentzea sp. BCCO 10_0061]